MLHAKRPFYMQELWIGYFAHFLFSLEEKKNISVTNISQMFTFLEKSTMKWIWIKQLSRITLLQMRTSWLQRGHASKVEKKQAERFDACRGCESRFVKSRATVEGRSWIADYKHSTKKERNQMNCDPSKQLLTHTVHKLSPQYLLSSCKINIPVTSLCETYCWRYWKSYGICCHLTICRI